MEGGEGPQTATKPTPMNGLCGAEGVSQACHTIAFPFGVLRLCAALPIAFAAARVLFPQIAGRVYCPAAGPRQDRTGRGEGAGGGGGGGHGAGPGIGSLPDRSKLINRRAPARHALVWLHHRHWADAACLCHLHLGRRQRLGAGPARASRYSISRASHHGLQAQQASSSQIPGYCRRTARSRAPSNLSARCGDPSWTRWQTSCL